VQRRAEFDEQLCDRKSRIKPAGKAGERFLRDNYPACPSRHISAMRGFRFRTRRRLDLGPGHGDGSAEEINSVGLQTCYFGRPEPLEAAVKTIAR
jgi:hypothetical protein